MSDQENLPGEEWREVPGTIGYLVSSMGRARGKRGQLLKATPTPKGYPRLNFYGDKKGSYFLHTAVLESFVGPRPEGMEVRHLNGNPADARLSNLAWGTRTQNRADRIAHGTDSACDEHGCAKLTWEQVEIIRAAYEARTDAQEWGARRLAAEFGVHNATVSRVARRQLWKKESPAATHQPIPTKGNDDTDKGEKA